jgi:peptidoglycan/xylan/chitin deacetylase (PgdA/CDA1 family)
LVSNKPPAHVKHLYPVRNEKQFKKDLEFFSKNFTSITEVPENPVKYRKNSFFLSFDDGLSECYHVIIPILKTYGIKAAFFVNTDFVDNKDLFYKYKASLIIDKIMSNEISEARLNEIVRISNVNNIRQIVNKLRYLHEIEKELIEKINQILMINFFDYTLKNNVYLSIDQINSLIEAGHLIGSHGKSHYLFSEIPLELQIEEIKGSLDYITDNFKTEKRLFAFPFTDFGLNQELFSLISNENIADYTFGTAGIKKDTAKNNIQRIPIERYKISAQNQIKTQLLLFFIKRWFKRHIIIRNLDKEFHSISNHEQ